MDFDFDRILNILEVEALRDVPSSGRILGVSRSRQGEGDNSRGGGGYRFYSHAPTDTIYFRNFSVSFSYHTKDRLSS